MVQRPPPRHGELGGRHDPGGDVPRPNRTQGDWEHGRPPVFFTGNPTDVPVILQHYWSHVHALHERIVQLTLALVNIPYATAIA